MSNMGYCRFENTAGDLRDCVDALEEMENGPSTDEEPLSSSEERAFRQLANLCERYLALAETRQERIEEQRRRQRAPSACASCDGAGCNSCDARDPSA